MQFLSQTKFCHCRAMEDEKFKDLLEDEELVSLRLAALASKQKKLQNSDVSIFIFIPVPSVYFVFYFVALII